MFPDFSEEAPLERKITTERISFITEDENTTMEFASPRLGRPENASYSVLARALRPLAGVEGRTRAGAECIFGLAVDGLVWEDGHVAGVSAGGDEITAEVTILADGVNSLLTEQAKLATKPQPHQLAVSVKENHQPSRAGHQRSVPGRPTTRDRPGCSPARRRRDMPAADSCTPTANPSLSAWWPRCPTCARRRCPSTR